jgi:mono/diheme cytochrome c family protein
MKRGAVLCAISMLLFPACHRTSQTRPAAVVARPSLYEQEIGNQVFRSYCAGCHGDTGQGDGFNAYNLDPHPRDLSDPAFQAKTSDVDLADAIRRGGSGVGLSSLMPPWGHTLDARQIDAVVLYIRTLKQSGAPGASPAAGVPRS